MIVAGVPRTIAGVVVRAAAMAETGGVWLTWSRSYFLVQSARSARNIDRSLLPPLDYIVAQNETSPTVLFCRSSALVNQSRRVKKKGAPEAPRWWHTKRRECRHQGKKKNISAGPPRRVSQSCGIRHSEASECCLGLLNIERSKLQSQRVSSKPSFMDRPSLSSEEVASSVISYTAAYFAHVVCLRG